MSRKELEIKRKKLEIIKLETSIAEMEYTIEERMADIQRIEESIKKARAVIDTHAKGLEELTGRPSGAVRNG